MSTGQGQRQMCSNQLPANLPGMRKHTGRKVSMDHGYARTGKMRGNMNRNMMGDAFGGANFEDMNEMMMMDLSMMGGDPYGSGAMIPPFMPMHPSDAAMGQRMMDFPTHRFPQQSRLQAGPNDQRSARDMMYGNYRGVSRLQYRGHPINSSNSNDFDGDMYGQKPNMNGAQLMGMAPRNPSDNAGGTTGKKERAPSSTSFPTKLYKILADPQYSKYVSWLSHGRAWRVLKPKAFEEDVIPKFFRSDRYASFMRQVNGWGFKRITEGPDLNAYYHEMFLRGLPQVCAKMRRPQKGQAGATKELGQSPDFYKISMFAPLPSEDDGPPMPKQPKSLGPSSTIPRKSQMITDAVPKTSPSAISREACTQSPSTSNPTPASALSATIGVDITQNQPDFKSKKKVADHGIDESSVTSNVSGLSSQSRGPITERSADIMMYQDGFTGGRGFHDVLPASGNNSISSWNDSTDQDGMWAMQGGAGFQSPGGSQAAMHDNYKDTSSYNSGTGQVTPPHSRGTLLRPNGIPREFTQLRVPFSQPSPLAEEEEDPSGLSVADLCYLTKQNRILLNQAHAKDPTSR